jgi:excisionase family DNA binding protein
MNLLSDALRSEIRSVVEEAVEAATCRILATQEKPSEWMTAKQVAETLAMTEAAVRRAAQRGDLPSTKLPSGAVRFERTVIDSWARSAT